jgi:hypothetical protein
MVVPHLGFSDGTPSAAMGPAWPHIHKSVSGLDKEHKVLRFAPVGMTELFREPVGRTPVDL